ncbi:hypothetical protein I4U23_028992 [Adineta vaga]|nr:hypothetical protein I4U23_028992 [Adineta vaga]
MNKQKSSTLFRSSSEMVRRTLCGVIDCSIKRSMLANDDVIMITLCDITNLHWARMDFPHIPLRYVISNMKLDDFTCFPIPFTLYYNDGEIDENLCYGIRCDILDKSNEIIYSSERFVPVLTDKHPKTNIHIAVSPKKDS